MNTKLFAAIGTVLALWLAPSANAITLSFAPNSQAVNVGSTATVDLVISGLGASAAPSLGAFDVDVGFDPSALSFSGALFGSQLDLFGLGDFQSVTSGAGTVNLAEFSVELPDDLDSLQMDAFVLATLSFKALVAGSSTLSISVNALGDSLGDPLQAGLVAGTIRSTGVAVPEPVILSLMGIGMLGMLALGRRRRG